MPHRRPKRSFVLPVVTTLAVAAPLASYAAYDTADYRTANNSDLAAIPAQLAEVALAQAPDVVLPLRELTGLNLPDLHLADLKRLPLPRSIPLPSGLVPPGILPPGVQLPAQIPLPQLDKPQADGPGSTNSDAPQGTLAPQNQPGVQIPAPLGPQTPLIPGAPAPVIPQFPAAPQVPGAQTPAAPLVPGSQTSGTPQAPSMRAPDTVQIPGARTPAAPQVPAVQALATTQGQAAAQAPTAPHIPGAPQVSAALRPPGASTRPQSAAVFIDEPVDGPGSDGPAPGSDTLAPAPEPAAPTPAQAAPEAPAPASDPTPAAAPPAPVIPGADPESPALVPGAVPRNLADQVGAQVKELTRDKPFSMVALTAKDLADTTAMIRSRNSDGTWGPWYPTARVDTGRNDHVANTRTGTEPIYVGSTKAVQVLTTHKADGALPGVTPARADDPALVAGQDLSAVLIDPGRGAADSALSTIAAPLAGNGPKVITRDQWGADPALLCDKPTYDDGLGGITVHHTAGRNDYTQAESAGIVRAIYAYHAKTLGWCDIGYNALVDKYGQIFEGRAGGLDKPVEGAHAGGFNKNTSGVAIMGNYETEPPSDAAIQAIGQFIGWRAKVAGLDPKGRTTMYSEGTQYTKYKQGQAVQLPIVFAHRDVGNTVCPGDAAYALMDRIRETAANAANATNPSPGTDAKAAVPADNSSPASGTAPAAAPGTTPESQRTQADIAALAALTAKLLDRIGTNPVAKYWAGQGGPNSRFGAATAEPEQTPGGGQVGKFVNGYVYAAPDGAIIELAGHLLDRFIQLGGESGVLGLPLKNAYPVPGGMRTDFQNGSLIMNTATGIVTALYKIYSDTAAGQPDAGAAAPQAPAN